MAKIPKKQDSLTEILESGMVEQEYRPYIGMSGIMGKCQRKIWYDFHWSYTRLVTRRTQRLFDRGDLEEARVVKDLREAGLIITDCLEDQVELKDQTGHIGGHPDGKALNVPTAPKTEHLLEIKTMASKYYANFKRVGLAKSDPVYWGQVHTYCGECGLTRILFCVTNKDTEERTYMRYEYDPGVHKDCMSIATGVLMSEQPPKKIGDKTWFECKWCDAKDICHRSAPIKKTCRSCQYADIEMEGRWTCSHPEWHNIHEPFGKTEIDIPYSNTLTKKRQMMACEMYELSDVY